MKLVTVLGARPQFIKAGAVSRAIKDFDGIEEVIVHTGQHYDPSMSQIFFDEMEIPVPRHNLGIQNLSHGAMTGKMIEAIEKILLDECPDYVMVYGDTNSTLAAALAAAKLRVPIVHIEAGLRSFDMNMPEEINRIITDRISKVLFCPTKTAVQNLEAEGFRDFPAEIIHCGDVMQDAAMYYYNKAKNQVLLDNLSIESGNYVLATIHREENTNDQEKLKEILSGLNAIDNKIKVVVPLHPRTRKIISEAKIETGIRFINPVGYFDMLNLLANSQLIVTDSGGLQKEAFFFRKYCITTRPNTEWVELVDGGVNVCTGANASKIEDAFQDYVNREFPTGIEQYYGEGDAAYKICKSLLSL